MTRLFAAGFFTAALGAALSQAPAVTFLGMDTSTLGNWKGVYGQDGYYLPDFSYNLPSYTILNPIQDNQRLLDIWSCWSTPCDPRQPLKPQPWYTANERVKSYFYNRVTEDFQMITSDSQTHRIALYFADYEFYGRSITVTARNTTTGATLDNRVLGSYSGGVYLVYNYTGNVDFLITDNFPTTDLIPNATISGFFWGGSGAPPAPPEAPVVFFSPLGPASGSTVSGSVSLQTALDSVPGVTTVQYYLDGAPLGPPLNFFVTDILATPPALPFNYTWDTTTASNGSHTITAVATDANGNSTRSAGLSLTVNNGSSNTTPVLTVSPSTISFTAGAGAANPSPQGIAIGNNGGGTLSWSAASNQGWLQISPSSGTGAANPSVSVILTGLNPGSYSGAITVSATGATNSPATIHVNLQVAAETSGSGAGSQTYVYVADPNNRRVQQFASNGAWVMSIGPGLSAPQNLNYPVNAATDASGNVYVADDGLNAVQKYSSSGAWLATFGLGTLSAPTGLAVDASGNLYAGDTGNGRVVEFDPSGNVRNTYTGLYTSGGYLGVAVDSGGNVYADDYYNGRLKKFSNSGALLATFGSGYWQAYPGDIQIDAAGNVWVADPYRGGLQEFSASGIHLGSVSGPGAYFAIDNHGAFWATCGYGFCQYSSTGALLETGGNPTGGSFGNGYGSCNGCFEGATGVAAAPPAQP